MHIDTSTVPLYHKFSTSADSSFRTEALTLSSEVSLDPKPAPKKPATSLQVNISTPATAKASVAKKALTAAEKKAATAAEKKAATAAEKKAAAAAAAADRKAALGRAADVKRAAEAAKKAKKPAKTNATGPEPVKKKKSTLQAPNRPNVDFLLPNDDRRFDDPDGYNDIMDIDNTDVSSTRTAADPDVIEGSLSRIKDKDRTLKSLSPVMGAFYIHAKPRLTSWVLTNTPFPTPRESQEAIDAAWDSYRSAAPGEKTYTELTHSLVRDLCGFLRIDTNSVQLLRRVSNSVSTFVSHVKDRVDRVYKFSHMDKEEIKKKVGWLLKADRFVCHSIEREVRRLTLEIRKRT